MGRNFIITEEQYESIRKLMAEGVLPQGTQKPTIDSPNKATGTEQSIKNAASKAISDAGADPNNVDVNQTVGDNLKVKVSGKDVSSNAIKTSTTTESRFITKQKMLENRLKKMKENSEIYTVGEFLNKLK